MWLLEYVSHPGKILAAGAEACLSKPIDEALLERLLCGQVAATSLAG